VTSRAQGATGTGCYQNRLNACNNIDNDARCQAFCQQNQQDCNNALVTWCSKSQNVTKDICWKDFCVNNPGKCDTGAKAYCDQNPTDSNFCACFMNAFSSLPAALQKDPQFNATPPVCWNKKCTSGAAYMTKDQEKGLGGCIKCIQVMNLSDFVAQGNIDVSRLSQSCNVSTTGGTPSSGSGSGAASIQASNLKAKQVNWYSGENGLLLGVGGASILCICLFIVSGLLVAFM